jgi:predicted alpha/beta hydrolase family esterase
LSGAPTVVIVPGLRDHVEEHWQTHLHRDLPGSLCVPRLHVHKLSCRAWVDALDATIGAARGPVLLVAHSAGVMIVAHWARRHRREILGALLVTPPDFGVPLPEGYPPPHVLEENGWLPTPMERLPFPSIVAASTNDPLARFTPTLGLARAWGSKLVRLGNVGHMNPASGFGPWHDAATLIRQLTRPVREQA